MARVIIEEEEAKAKATEALRVPPLRFVSCICMYACMHACIYVYGHGPNRRVWLDVIINEEEAKAKATEAMTVPPLRGVCVFPCICVHVCMYVCVWAWPEQRGVA